MTAVDPYEKYKAFERREKRRRSRSAFDPGMTALVDSSGAATSLPMFAGSATHTRSSRPRVSSTVVRPVVDSDIYGGLARPHHAAAASTVARAPPKTIPADSSVIDRSTA